MVVALGASVQHQGNPRVEVGEIFMRTLRALAIAAAVPLVLAGPAAYAAYTEIPTTTEAVTDSPLTQFGAAREVTVTVKSSTGTGASPTGTVQFTVSPSAAGYISPANGVATLAPAGAGQSTAKLTFSATTPARESYSIKAVYTPDSGSSYTGSSNEQAATLTIFKRDTTVTLAALGGGGSGTNRTANVRAQVWGYDGAGAMAISPSGGTIVWQSSPTGTAGSWSANQAASVTGNAATLSVGGLQNNTPYYFRVVSWSPQTGENNYEGYTGPSAAQAASS
jgi:hypothetical protein